MLPVGVHAPLGSQAPVAHSVLPMQPRQLPPASQKGAFASLQSLSLAHSTQLPSAQKGSSALLALHSPSALHARHSSLVGSQIGWPGLQSLLASHSGGPASLTSVPP